MIPLIKQKISEGMASQFSQDIRMSLVIFTVYLPLTRYYTNGTIAREQRFINAYDFIAGDQRERDNLAGKYEIASSR